MSRLSVVMPVYNAARYVRQTIESILRQTFTDFEFIIIDDGSTDDSLSILREFEKNDSRLHIVTRANKGIVATLNEGCALAKGEYIARIDADDTCDPRRFELQVAAMDADPNLVALGSNSIVTDPQGRRLGEFPVPLTHEEIDAAHLRGDSSIHHPAAMIRTDALRRVGGYRDLCPVEDLDLWLRLAEVGRVGNLPQPLLIRRLTPDGLVASKEPIRLEKLRNVLNDAWSRRGLPGAPVIPTRSPATVVDRYRQWGWMALRDGQVRTSRRYARQALAREPLKPMSWKLMLCALRGH